MRRISPREAFGQYECAPAEWHPAYDRVSYYARALAKDIIGKSKDYADLKMVTDGDWKTSVCKTLRISGPERRNAKSALDSLVRAGLLLVEDGLIRVVLVPSPAPSLSRPCPVPHSVLDSDSSQVVEIIQNTTPDPLSKLRESVRARVHAPTREEQGAGQIPAKTDRARVHELLAEVLCKTVDQIAPDLASAEVVARAARAEGGLDQVGFERAVRRLLEAWQADPHPLARKHSLRNMVVNLTKYTAQTRERPQPVRATVQLVPHPYLSNATVTPEKRDQILREMDSFGSAVNVG